MSAPVILNKIDPVIVSNVEKQTVEGIVHTKDGTKVSKDTKEKREGKSSYKGMKEKLDGFNSLLKGLGIDAELIIDEEGIIALDKDGGVIKKYTKEALFELFSKMEYMIGVFIDTKR